MAIYYSHKRLLLSLRQQFHSSLKLNFILANSRPISTSIIHPLNPNFLSSSPFSIKILSPFRSSSLINNLSFKVTFNCGRTFATRLSDSSNRPPKETIMLEGCDFEHWLVVVETPDSQLTRDEIIDGYIKTLAQILGSEEEARMKIYSVSTRHYFAFGALISEELGYKLKELPNVRWVLPDSYMDVKNKTYAGEPFINGQAVPYDPKYHEVWVRNHEESLRNNNKNRRRQKDPNSRSRSSASVSTRGSSSGNWTSSPVPQNQSLETSNTQNLTSQPSSVSNPVTHQQNWMPPDDSPYEAAHSAQMQIPSNMQSHVLKQAPPAYSHNQAPPTFSHNQALPTYSQNQAPSTYSQNQALPIYSQNQAFQPSGMHDHTMSRSPPPPTQSGASQSHIGVPPVGFENQSRHSSHMQNQTPPPSSTSGPNDPVRHIQSQSWETSAGYQSHPPQTPIPKHNSSYNNSPPSAPANNFPYPGQTRGPASGYQILSPPPPTLNSFSYANVPPSAHTGGSVPSEVQQNVYFCRDIPHQAQNDGSSNGYPSQYVQQYQNNYSSHNAMNNSKSVVTPSAQNRQNTNVAPSAPSKDMPSHTWKQQMSRREVPSEVQQNGYYGNSPHHMHNGRAHIFQNQQYQHTSRGVQSSNATTSPQVWNYPSTAPISHGMESHHVQHNDSAAQNAGYNGGKLPNDTSMEIKQTRDYQERDIPADDYMYASK